MNAPTESAGRLSNRASSRGRRDPVDVQPVGVSRRLGLHLGAPEVRHRRRFQRAHPRQRARLLQVRDARIAALPQVGSRSLQRLRRVRRCSRSARARMSSMPGSATSVESAMYRRSGEDRLGLLPGRLPRSAFRPARRWPAQRSAPVSGSASSGWRSRRSACRRRRHRTSLEEGTACCRSRAQPWRAPGGHTASRGAPARPGRSDPMLR